MKLLLKTIFFGLLAGVISIPANAETFTLAELIAGQNFTIGNTKFTGWTLDTGDTTADPSQITVDTIDDTGFPGFQITANGELAGDEATLVYTFLVERTDLKPVIAGAFLDITGHRALDDDEIGIDLIEDNAGGLELEVFVNAGNDTQLRDAAAIEEGPVQSILFENSVKCDEGRDGSVELETYVTQIILLSGTDPGGPVLTDLVLSEGTLSPTFESDKREYTATVPFDTTSMTVTATAEDGTTLTLNGQSITSGVPSPAQNLEVGQNELVIQLATADAESSYTVLVNRQTENPPTVEFTGTNATGIRNLLVGGVLYDVAFVEGSAESLYGAYPGTYDFPTDERDGGPAADAVNAILAALATQPEVVTVGPGASRIFNIGFGGFIAPIPPDFVETREFVSVAQGYYYNEWQITSNPDTYIYDWVESYALFTEVGSEPDAPTLAIVSSAANEITISWSPATAGFVLQETTDVGSGSWTDSPSGDTNPVTIQMSGPTRFYKLRN